VGTKRRKSDAEFLPKFGRILACCRAEPSWTFGEILRPNFGPSLRGDADVCRLSFDSG